MICRKCGHTDGMHDERGCVALNCSCDRYVPVPTNVVTFEQPGRGPLMSYARRISIWSNRTPRWVPTGGLAARREKVAAGTGSIWGARTMNCCAAGPT
jgi:hypothetical protein